MITLLPIQNFKKPGLWLAVIVKRRAMFVVASSTKPEEALENARKAGYRDASLIKSAKTYAAFTA